MNREDFLNLTCPQILKWRAENTGNRPALREKEFGTWSTYTWSQYYYKVVEVAMGLRKLGFGKQDKMVLIGDNIPEMMLIELAVQSLGGVAVGLYQTSLPHEIADILDYVDAKMVFAMDQEQVDKLVEVKAKIPKVEKIIYEDPRGMRNYRTNEWYVFIEDLYQMGAQEATKEPDFINQAIAAGHPDDVMHFCLTSGTTGRPKAAMLTHRNFINMGLRLTEVDPLVETDEYLSMLPMAWIGEQMNCLGVAMVIGLCINFPEDVETAMSDLKEIGPHVMFGAPRIWENIRSNIWLKIDEAYWFNKALYEYFIEVGQKAAKFHMLGKPMPLGLKFKHWLGKMIIFRPLVNQLGLMRLKRAYTGGAALGPELFTFYQAIGVNLKQIYGQTEIIGIAYIHRDGDVRHDTVGLPLPGTQCKISENGEILSQSLSVCKGYYKNDEATKELLHDGWLHSGDAGYLDENGHLIVIDRVSDVMHNAKGEMFSPMFLENKLKFSPYIKEAVIYGDKRDYVSCFINVDPVTVGKWAEDHGISYTTYMDLSQKRQVAELINREVEKVNANLDKEYYRIHRFVLLYKLLDADDGELTKTGKIRRKFVQERYQDLVDALYDEAATQKAVKATFQYQDGQTATVETTISIFTMEKAS